MTRISVGNSYLKSHGYSIGLEIDNTCPCDNKTQEAPLHYIFCTKYSEQSLLLYQKIEEKNSEYKKTAFKKEVQNLYVWLWNKQSRKGKNK